MTMQLSKSEKRPTLVCLSKSEHASPYMIPNIILREKTAAKMVVPENKEDNVSLDPRSVLSVSNITIDTASLRMLSPKMML